MIDLHCHILPAVDDGAADLEDSIAMAAQAEADGIEVVCATPHIRHDHAVVVHELPDKVGALNQALRERGIDVRVTVGGEVAEPEADGLSDAELKTVSLCGTGRWLLLEPGPGPLSDSLAEAVDRLRVRGTRSLIAHPERHLSADFLERLRELVQRGALVQATAAYLDDPVYAPGMLEMARHGLIHVLGSDAHSSRAGRPLRLSPGFDRLEEQVSRTRLDWSKREAPAAIVSGADLSPPH
jgi:protein-tyrosine phosphatase